MSVLSIGNYYIKLAKYAIKNSKKMAINMLRLFLGIAVRKVSQIFDFGLEIINWAAL